ncbi:alanine racemase [Sporosarcina sp. BI001-red]|uniref:alanine racemase n=1 Tax=Sporosarcina sp. BI001-red TaxID=2282866 RepID=UPI000E28534B|nr:alanine racemase [Sporosarcina sp. BI001-red]REB07764.1 alanine racemase [Sporosarcina sp. BI001-red]
MTGTFNYRPTRAIVDVRAIRANVRNLNKILPSETGVIAVVKADGYGHGATESAQAAFQEGAIMAAVATPDEALSLRDSGIHQPILVLGPVPITFLREAIRQDIIVTIPGVQWAQSAADELQGIKESLKTHVKIDTGMGRIGVRSEEEILKLLEILEGTSAIRVEGIFTHFATADEQDTKRTEEQFRKFNRLVEYFPERPKLVHAANSAAALRFPNFALDAVRFGIGMYGIAPSEVVAQELPFQLERALQLETEISFVKQAQTKEPISYGATYETEPGEWIATLPIGYADGLKRGLRNQQVLIRGRRIPIVGTICMDQCMVRLPERLPEGEPVVLLGKQGDEEITMEEWATRIGTIPYEIAVTIARRVQRQYFGD